MSSETLVYIIISGITALLIAGFQYYKNKKGMSKLSMLFLFLRFITIFSVILLLINPKFEQVVLSVEKPNLVLAVDNSSSIKYLGHDTEANTLLNQLRTNKELQDKFNLSIYTFGNTLKPFDSLSFTEQETNVNQAFSQLTQIYKQSTSPTVLITDGNQTYGNNYEFAYLDYKQPVYPVILGDTISYVDLKIQQLNVNKYAYLKNKFPVETILVYNGIGSVKSQFTVTIGNSIIYSEAVNFSKENNSKIINFTLPANQVGVQVYKATLSPLNSEKNTLNNSKNFAVEVIDQKTKVAIVSDIIHPDLGALKKSIESNEQRSVSFFNSKSILNQINDFQLIVLYQPNDKFKALFEQLDNENKNRFIIVGPKTDIEFLNNINKSYEFEITYNTENYQAALEKNYTPFFVDDIDFESFPPLHSYYSSLIALVPFETILHKTLNGIDVGEPLLGTFETQGRREALLLGENIWQWRSQSYVETKSFHGFDNFFNKLIQYLASNKLKSRLNVDYQSFYNGSGNVIVTAQYFDKNYIFNERETLNITVADKISKESKTFPLILKNNNYEVDLSSLSPSEYDFKVHAEEANISKTGSFTILEYNVEQQFLNANVTKLEQLASNSSGKAYFIDNTDALIDDLLNDNRFSTIQKSHKNSLPLIDWKYLLAIIALSLSLEWFLRKYNGLI
ncbi:VWA domain-containing protein [Aestuariibaculum lutulentum]|uniref:VWA domain-containing protein n=1 Tax=Aestuariibaculum lutulentum TaxID=2920935 RepID=A0ABS9RLH4_9FLAO|nr:VWA domain-containing protein [Aestuariibaculum lutulentum]MCH4553809.1 VWA domain-containing protein [Aestuariibaculum lutulentum]